MLAERVAEAYRRRDAGLGAAVAALDEALKGIQTGLYGRYHQRAALNLRAALIYYLRAGHLNAHSRMAPIPVGDEDVDLGVWLRDLRRRGIPTGRAWIRSVLETLGWRGEAKGVMAVLPGLPGELGLLADRVVVERGEAVRGGQDPTDPFASAALSAAVGAYDDKLVSIQTGPYHDDDQGAALYLRVLLAHYLHTGDVNPPEGVIWRAGDKEVDPGAWLGVLRRRGIASAREWVRPVLDALGDWKKGEAPAGEGVGPVVSAGHAVLPGGEGGHVDLFEQAYEGDGSQGWLDGPVGPQGAEQSGLVEGMEGLGTTGLARFDRVSEPDLVGEGATVPVPVDETGLATYFNDPASQPMDLDALDQIRRGDFIGTANRNQPEGALLDQLDDFLSSGDEDFFATVNRSQPVDSVLDQLDEFSSSDGEEDFAEDEGLVQDSVSRGQGDGGRVGVAGERGGVSERESEDLQVLAEGVAEAYRRRDAGLGAAVAALDEALKGIQTGLYGRYHQRAALNLRAALIYYLRAGHVNAHSRTAPIPVGDEMVKLGYWLNDLRRGRSVASAPWVMPVLKALGWEVLQVSAGELALLATRVVEERDRAVRGGLDPTDPGVSEAYGAAVRAYDDKLENIRNGPYHENDKGAAHHLRALLEHYVDTGNVKPPRGVIWVVGDRSVDPGTWLHDLRRRGIKPAREWLRPVLKAFVDRETGGAPAGEGVGPVVSAGHAVLPGGESSHADYQPMDLDASDQIQRGDFIALTASQEEGAEGEGLVQDSVSRGQGDSERVGAAGKNRPVSEGESEHLKVLAGGVAEAYLQRDAGPGAAVEALDEALKDIQDGPYGDHNKKAARNLRAALIYYVHVGHLNAPHVSPAIRVGDEDVNLGNWLHKCRVAVVPGRKWIRSVLDTLDPDWDVNRFRPVVLSRPVRNLQLAERDLKHSEWDLTNPEWDLIEEPLAKVVTRNARNSLNALLFRVRNGIPPRAEIPAKLYGGLNTGTAPFISWAKAGALLGALEKVEERPGVVHPVVERSLRAAVEAAGDFMARRVLRSMPSGTSGNVQSGTEGDVYSLSANPVGDVAGDGVRAGVSAGAGAGEWVGGDPMVPEVDSQGTGLSGGQVVVPSGGVVGSVVGVPRGVGRAVRGGVVERLGGELWWAARGV
ncbi:hypothetical protein, partial [Streptomyces sp. NPDC059489]|uniref:hypothetical protein n=1 Tax=Streptomyces sp. NPDC059489 TaxID=3346849 RepID=UPI003681C244